MPDLICSIIATGTSSHPRFQVADSDNKFWTGEGWTDEEADSRLYASLNDAGRAIQQILLTEHGGKPVRRFIAPVYLDLHSDTKLTMDQITDWLVNVARLTIDAERHGNGPVHGALGLTWIDWGQLQEVKVENK